MNRKQLILLIVTGAIIVALGAILTRNRSRNYEAAHQRLGEKVFANFPINDVEQITIRQPQSQQVTLARENDRWVVRERAGYPANFDNIADMLRKVWELKVAQPVKVGASQLARLELVPPSASTNSGTLVEFKDKTGKVLHTLLLGKKHMREGRGDSPFGGSGWPDGRFVMVGTNVQSVALVAEPFANVDAKPTDWISKDFVKVEKHKSIAVASATNSWKLSRASETNDWKLAEAKADEQLDSGKISSVTSAFAWPSFTDVATNTTPEQAGLDKPAITGTIETLDGFQYEIKIGKQLAEDKDDYFVQVAANATLQPQRTPGKDEKPEDKAKLDKEHKEKFDKLDEKLKAEKSLAKWIYHMPKHSVEPFFKARKELLVEKKEEPGTNSAPSATSAAGGLPAPLNTSVTLPEIPKLPQLPATAPAVPTPPQLPDPAKKAEGATNSAPQPATAPAK